jgi:hypothetical protein
MKKILILFGCALLSTTLKAQSSPMVFQEVKTTFGIQDLYVKTITKTDASSNVYTAGMTLNSSGDYDAYVVKFSPSGNLLWSRQISGGVIGGADFIAGMQVTSTYIAITGGITTSSSTPTTDMFTAKLDATTGSTTWISYFNGSGNLYDAGKHVVIDGSSNIYVTGGSYNSTNLDFVTIKYNSSGVQQWSALYDYLGYDDAAIKVVTSGSNLTITGAVTTATANAYKLATLTLAQSTGSLLATSVGTAVTTTSVDVVADMTTDAAGNVVIIGSNTVSGQLNFYVQKVSATTLASIFTYTWNGSSSLDDVAKAVAVDQTTGDIYISGFSTSSTTGRDITVIKLNSSGIFQWSQLSGYVGNDESADLVLDASANVYITGYKTSGTTNYYTAKYSSAGTKIWEIEMDNNMHDNATNICLDISNNVIVAGQTEVTSGVFNYTALRYSQRDVLVPLDLNSEPANANFQYYTNLGQVTTYSGTPAPLATYYTTSTNPQLYINPTKNYFVYSKGDTLLSTTDSIVRIDLEFLSANPIAKSYNYEETEGSVSYFLNNLTKPIIGLKGNNRILVPDLYPNIDLHIYNNVNGIKYYFVLKPGANLSDINFKFTGANSTSLISNSIDVNCFMEHLAFNRPKVYQINSTPAIINSGNGTWRSTGTDTYGIITSVTTNTALSIVVMVETNKTTAASATGNLQWSTFFGDGTVADLRVNKINGKQYLTGTTSSAVFPVINGLDMTQPYNSYPDAFIAQFKSNNARDWVTYYGGVPSVASIYESADYGTGIDYDNQGYVYVMGNTWSDSIPTKKSANPSAYFLSKAPNPSLDNNRDIFFLKLDSTGGLANNSVEFCTYLGGDPKEESGKLRTAGTNFYMLGLGGNGSSTLPTPFHFKTGAFNQTTQGKCQIYKFSNDCVYDWGTNFDNGVTTGVMTLNGLDWNNSTGLTVTGYSESSNLHTTTAGANIPYRGGTGLQKGDAYWTLFDSNDNIQYSTFIGGANYDEGFDVVIAGSNSYIVGQTTATSTTRFPYKYASGQYIDSTYNGSTDGFIASFRNATGTLVWSSYFGGSNDDEIRSICADQANGVYIQGSTFSSDLQTYTSSGLYSQGLSSANNETFVGRLSTSVNNFDWLTYFGGTNADGAVKVSCDKNKSLYITGAGSIASNTFPTNPGTVGTSYFSTNGNIYLSRFDLSLLVGVNERLNDNSNELLVYPNPTNGMIYIKGNVSYSKLEVYNTMGQKVLEESDTNSLNVQALSSGVYIIKMISKEENRSAKIIKN